MNLYDFARATEESGARYYRECAEQAEEAGVKGIFSMLAQEEEKLLEKLDLIRSRFPRIEKLDSSRLQRKSIIFDKLRRKDHVGEVHSDLEAYQLACHAEQQLVDQYQHASEAEKDPQTREMLGWLAALERHELHELEGLYDFANAPTDYLEWGEFSNLDEFHNFGRYEDLRKGNL